MISSLKKFPKSKESIHATSLGTNLEPHLFKTMNSHGFLGAYMGEKPYFTKGAFYPEPNCTPRLAAWMGCGHKGHGPAVPLIREMFWGMSTHRACLTHVQAQPGFLFQIPNALNLKEDFSLHIEDASGTIWMG